MNKAQKIVLWVVGVIMSIVCVIGAEEYFLYSDAFLTITPPTLIIGSLLFFSLKK